MSKTKVMNHHCEHKFQDKHYGKGRRVFNQVVKAEGTWRCTVCGKEERSSSPRRR
jgi:hypothetical protein